ncbi:MAG: hypothetical protein ACRD4S_08185 [Candidatus Acidiferrales bacterium]
MKLAANYKRFLVVWCVLVGVVAIYVGSVFYSRSEDVRRVQEQAAERKRAQDAEAVESMGGNNFDILNFYADPGYIHRGDSAKLCYAVSNAKSVTLEPQSNPVWPSYSRCVSVSPVNTTTYTLTATDAAGHTKRSTLEVQVR